MSNFSLPGTHRAAPEPAPAPAPAPAPVPASAPTRCIREVGCRTLLSVWEADDVPCVPGRDRHAADVVLPDMPGDYAAMVKVAHAGNYFERAELWPTKCAHCDFEFTPAGSFRSLCPQRVYDTPSGEPSVGDIFYVPCPARDAEGGRRCWDNCPGQHLHAIVPDGTDWDIDSRAGNCTMMDDWVHRCWVRHGLPENGELVTVDKGGATCAAGGGSIQTRAYHGFLHGGSFRAV